MGKIIAFANQKGGVGKTTSCVNIAASLGILGHKVLIIDLDPQGNTTSGVGISKKSLKSTTKELLNGAAPLSDIIIETAYENLDVIPTNTSLAGAEFDLFDFDESEFRIKNALAEVKDKYDYILIDCPPSLALLTVNALTAASSILIPIQGEYYALEGLSQLMNTIKLAKKFLNPQLEVEGVVLTMYDNRSRLVQNVTEEIYKFFGKKVFSTKIPRNIRLGEAPSYGLPVMLFEPKCVGSIAYKALAEEFLTRNGEKFDKITDVRVLKRKI